MSTDLPDDFDPLDSARREAAARAQGARNRYLLATADVIDVHTRKRKTMNFRKSRTVHLTLAATAFSLVVAITVVANREVIAQQVIELAKSFAPPEKADVQVAAAPAIAQASSPETPVAAVAPESQSEDAAQAPALDQASGTPQVAELNAQGNSEVAETTEPLAQDSQSPVLAAVAPTAVPASAPAAKPVEPVRTSSQPTPSPVQVKPVVLMPLPIDDAAQHKGVVPPPKLAVAPAPKASALPRSLTTTSTAARSEGDGAEPAVSPELVAAVNNARSKVEPVTDAKQPAKTANGVFVQLPERKTAKAPAANSVAPSTDAANSAKGSTAPAPRSFTVVSHFTGGLLVRVGQQVTHVRIGENLPNGKRLVSVNESTGGYMAE